MPFTQVYKAGFTHPLGDLTNLGEATISGAAYKGKEKEARLLSSAQSSAAFNQSTGQPYLSEYISQPGLTKPATESTKYKLAQMVQQVDYAPYSEPAESSGFGNKAQRNLAGSNNLAVSSGTNGSSLS